MGSIARKARRLREQEDDREERLDILRERTGQVPTLPRAWVGSMKNDDGSLSSAAENDDSP